MFVYFLMPIALLANLFAISRLVPNCKNVLNAIISQAFVFLLIFLSAIVSKTLLILFGCVVWALTIGVVCWRLRAFGRYMSRSYHYLQVAWLYIFLALFCYGNPGENLGHQVAIALWTSVDNNITAIISNLFVENGSGFWKKTILGDIIPISDRVSPALGLALPLRLWSGSDNLVMIAGISLQTLWVFPVAHLLRRTGDLFALRLMVIATLPVIVFFTLYSWWKIYAAAIFLVALIMLVERQRIHVLAFCLGLITHASHVYALPALAHWKHIKYRPIFLWSSIILLLSIAVFFFTLPPSGQLVRWHIFGEPNGFGIPIQRLFEQKFFSDDFFARKISNFKNSIYPDAIASAVMGTRPGHNDLFLRYIQQYSFFLSFGYLLVFVKNSREIQMRPQYFWFVAITYLTTNMLEYGSPMSEAILHHRPFVELLLLITIITLYIRKNALLIVIFANTLNWIFVWRPLQNFDGSIAPIQYHYLIPYAVIVGISGLLLTHSKRKGLVSSKDWPAAERLRFTLSSLRRDKKVQRGILNK